MGHAVLYRVLLITEGETIMPAHVHVTDLVSAVGSAPSSINGAVRELHQSATSFASISHYGLLGELFIFSLLALASIGLLTVLKKFRH